MYLFYTGRNFVHIIISSIICHARLYQVFAHITLNIISYLYLLIINIPFFPKLLMWLSVMSANICYNLRWQMMLDIIMFIIFLPVQSKYGILIIKSTNIWRDKAWYLRMSVIILYAWCIIFYNLYVIGY